MSILLALLLFVLILGGLGLTGAAGISMNIIGFIVGIFVVFFILSFLLGRLRGPHKPPRI